MDYADLLKLLETVKSPALVVLSFIAWQTFRAAGKALDRLESIDKNLLALVMSNAQVPDALEKIDADLDRIGDKVNSLPFELIKAQGAGRR